MCSFLRVVSGRRDEFGEGEAEARSSVMEYVGRSGMQRSETATLVELRGDEKGLECKYRREATRETAARERVRIGEDEDMTGKWMADQWVSTRAVYIGD